jgi:hypothetical protein
MQFWPVQVRKASGVVLPAGHLPFGTSKGRVCNSATVAAACPQGQMQSFAIALANVCIAI